ncbi:aromatic ring-hydroxylating oxygenase subunit alpha [Mycobacterium xenopi]|uniref:Rieske domain-containing protein n=2 Tax=Mycobacterium xenopi TaxID=1789 RepID=A0AAD1M212_MYCXE|nr:aromatic ring-hydroxylating dioxygenase subunit alpha [Mycobacterium xenopi]MDA3641377.1 aromatic ring-hydroxylating dioxygenase subunit alpha [Mycobacterium xenopi]MDA3659278.1 aromatic ring-hydroxylating dioxygenase subunit alpha [Mycobacterium xenopi]MDA3663641.1 aromatic ring-hydroxylating dioxygenase subunit alpha [Mycobacterium xenopi]ORX19359.1 (2Fe-2S)-binding protein [Mycobacterium xenopi]SPX89340.1 Rieske (2Fe-2S) domain-containing protein [Mycobacterium xenopi]
MTTQTTRTRREDAIGAPPERPTLVPAERYYSPAFAQLELQRMWPKVWQVACTVDHVADPGDYFEYRCGPYSILIVRGDDGALRAFQNVCRHRGNSLCAGSGSGLRELRCGYHGWTWDLAGALKRVPRRKGFGGIRMSDFPLFAAGVDTWERLVFVNLDLDATPLMDFLEAMPHDVAWCGLGDFRCYATMTVEIDANWKTIADGYSETYHVQTLHPELHKCMDDVYAPQVIWGHTGKSEQLYGVPSPDLKQTPSDAEVWDAYVDTQGALMGVAEGTPLPPDQGAKSVADVIAERTRAFATERGVDLSWASTDQLMRLHQYNVFPNMTLLTNADHLTVMASRPGPDPDHGELVMMLWTRMPPGAPRSRPTDVRMTADEAAAGLVMTQDISVLAGVQRGLHQPGLTHLVLSTEERRVINMHRNLERYLELPESARMIGGEKA